MSGHLLAIAVGPVQDFIAAARRTRDLWFGSRLLSEISRAVAVAISGHGKLIFPSSAKASNVANVILAELAAGEAPAAVAAAAKWSAQAKWRSDYADPAFNECRAVIRQDLWDEQVDDVVEFYAAWAPVTGDYHKDRARVMRLLAGRKNCRDFLPAKGRQGVPKSSLDGLRESVLADPAKPPAGLSARLRLRQGEQLDVVGLVKRVAEGKQPYPSVSRVAADPWLRGHKDRLGRVRAECERLGIRQIDVSPKGQPHYTAFPFEGTAVFRTRHRELGQEMGLPEGGLRPLAEAVASLGEPNPYLAVIAADGDRMGETLSGLGSAERHREFSGALAEFADQARGIVHEHGGVLVYAGGDDVFAFAPVDRCLDCARALHVRFGERLSDWGREAGTEITLSVGIAIGHFMENLEDLREYARAAEKHAKAAEDGRKNALAVQLHKRGGGPILVRGRWDEGDRLDRRLKTFASWLADRKVPARLAADLRGLTDVYDRWDVDPSQAIAADVLRVIRAKQPEGASVPADVVAELRARVKDAAALRQLADELLIARQIGIASRQAEGRSDGEEP